MSGIRVQFEAPLGNGLRLKVDREQGEDFYALVGPFTVETLGGYLIVRTTQAPMNLGELLHVPLNADRS